MWAGSQHGGVRCAWLLLFCNLSLLSGFPLSSLAQQASNPPQSQPSPSPQPARPQTPQVGSFEEGTEKTAPE